MKKTTKKIYDELFERYASLNGIKKNILNAFEMIKTTYKNGGTLYCAGNGGSASDSEHIVGELLKSFKKKRAIDKETANILLSYGVEGEYLVNKLEGSLPAVSLISQTGILTAFANDKSWDMAIAQQLYGLGKQGDCLLVLSTSGNSKNCIYAVLLAKAKGIKSIVLTGIGGGKLKEICDENICIPESETYKIQELQLPIYHCLCAMIEEDFF
ncbi:MAG: SIS domain-containing protein [Clostridia bacterium]|nr:SIS domain-containing protein [Clostridia bacterium]